MKEIWKVDKQKKKKGIVKNQLGWKMEMKKGGGQLIYNIEENMVEVGFVMKIN